MRPTRLTLIGCLGIGLSSFGLGACLDEGGEAVATGGASGSGGTDATGGVGVTGGTAGTAPSGGSSGTAGTANGGVTSTGGVGNTGGTDSGGTGGTTGGAGGVGTGGTTATGGTGAGMGGTAGVSGGMGGTSGGRGGMGAMSGAGGTAGSTATGGSGGSGGCVKGQTLGKEVAMIGESFIAATHRITQQIESRAKAAGSLAQSDRYVDNSQSGTTLANNQIPSQYTRAVQSSGTIKYVLMDGGGNDCFANNPSGALAAATTLFQTMAQNNTEKVVYFFYPDPIGANFSSLKTCLDGLRPQMKALCDGLTSPKCYWLDLRESWNGHPEYTSDGIHPTTAGSNATGDAIWEVMVEYCVAQ